MSGEELAFYCSNEDVIYIYIYMILHKKDYNNKIIIITIIIIMIIKI